MRALILITHDRSLIELVADRLWLTADGRIKPFPGDMDDYARFVLERAKLAASLSSEVKSAPSRPETGDDDGSAAARLAARKAAKKRRRRGL
jgi:ATP-binding cassette subfamily F protein 3